MTQLSALGLAAWMILAPAVDRPTSDDVLAMMASVDASGIYARVGHARQIADAIADKAEALDGMSLRESEALMAVFAAKESANQLCPAGDGGKSLGTFQLQGVERDVACDPGRSLPLWIAKAKWSVTFCADNAPDERLAALASGRCDRGREKVAARVRMARAIAAVRDDQGAAALE